MRATARLVLQQQPTFDTALEDVRRTELRAFLRSRRERLTPADVGLTPGFGRRRTPGLRREEVAELSGVGVTWYTWFEMGRDIHVSAKTLEAIARALRLNAVETEHLRTLNAAIESSPEQRPQWRAALHPAIAHVLHHTTDAAVIAYDPFLTALCWNAGGDAIFEFSRARNDCERNLAWRLFKLPGRKERWPDLDTVFHAVLGQFRQTYVRYPDDPLARAILADLRSMAAFEERWREHDIELLPEMSAALSNRPMPMHHPKVGTLQLFTAFLPLPGDGFLSTIAPADGPSMERFRVLMKGAEASQETCESVRAT
ncbi:MAG: helix-turn-helix domain-containing protein [Candidatus Eremiobacteraeota bacterium]|nr:helix-turn-helix domain-containing protein [Candidatus Eremiobacteraeota bacterium]MBC5820588.1 helix-turn-helix domain-containing protein [Candidatus Eremiobacteraeota bacterium]